MWTSSNSNNRISKSYFQFSTQKLFKVTITMLRQYSFGDIWLRRKKNYLLHYFKMKTISSFQKCWKQFNLRLFNLYTRIHRWKNKKNIFKTGQIKPGRITLKPLERISENKTKRKRRIFNEQKKEEEPVKSFLWPDSVGDRWIVEKYTILRKKKFFFESWKIKGEELQSSGGQWICAML